MTIPKSVRYSQALFIHPPWQPMSVLSHWTMSSGERTALMSPLEAMANLSLRASEAAEGPAGPALLLVPDLVDVRGPLHPGVEGVGELGLDGVLVGLHLGVSLLWEHVVRGGPAEIKKKNEKKKEGVSGHRRRRRRGEV